MGYATRVVFESNPIRGDSIRFDSDSNCSHITTSRQDREEGDDGEAHSPWKWRRRARKGRSVVHKSMEDNSGAVVVANPEALAQLLKQVRTGPAVPVALWPLKTLEPSSLSWSQFTLEAEAEEAVVAGS